jgi:hypothetical protein
VADATMTCLVFLSIAMIDQVAHALGRAVSKMMIASRTLFVISLTRNCEDV